MKLLQWLAVVMLLGVSATAESTESTESTGTGLSGLNAELNATGRIGTYEPQTPVHIAPASKESEAPREHPSPIVNPGDVPHRQIRPDALVEEELRPTDSAVRGCRVDVARRRQTLPTNVAAKQVIVRFNINQDGHVRDAEALWAPDTDLEIAACAKRVVSQWTFAKRPRNSMNVERTYRFR
jgi:hypothetical protein